MFCSDFPKLKEKLSIQYYTGKKGIYGSFFPTSSNPTPPPKLELPHLVPEIRKREFGVHEKLQYNKIKNLNVKSVIV